MRLRFAPSPTGQLHVGNARTAIFNWFLARGGGGTFVLRIEDTDAERSTAASEAGILADLRWLGLNWDEGPEVGGPFGPYRQSERLAIYRDHADRLRASGHAYYCFCSPDEIEADRQAALAASEQPRYAGRCRQLDPGEAAARVAAGEAAAVRFRVPDAADISFDDVVRGRVTFNTSIFGDPVILRSDGRPAYNFAVVVDDGLMRITHVVRGEDHVSNTPRQLLIYEALGYRPPVFAHLSLVLGPDQAPLSKRHGATSVADFRARGFLPEALVNYLALLGWSPGDDEEIVAVGELARRFRLENVGKRAAVFDPAKLAWMNRHYLKVADPERVADLAEPYFRAAGCVGALTSDGRAYLQSILPMAQGAVDRLDEMPERLRFLFDFDARRALEAAEVRDAFDEPGAREVVKAFGTVIAAEGRLETREAFRSVADRVRKATGEKGRALFHPIRVVLTGGVGGPELDLAVPAIDRGAQLPASSGWRSIVGCRERVAAFAAALGLR